MFLYFSELFLLLLGLFFQCHPLAQLSTCALPAKAKIFCSDDQRTDKYLHEPCEKKWTKKNAHIPIKQEYISSKNGSVGKFILIIGSL